MGNIPLGPEGKNGLKNVKRLIGIGGGKKGCFGGCQWGLVFVEEWNTLKIFEIGDFVNGLKEN